MDKGENITLNKKQIMVGIVVIALIIAGVIIYMNWSNIEGLMPSKTVALVNGIKINQDELDQAISAIKGQTNGVVNETQVIEQLVARELLVQETNKRGITVSVEEAEMLLSQHLSQQGATIDDLKSQLNKKSDYDFIIKGYQEQIALGKLTDQLLVSENISVSDEEAKEFFDKNQHLFNLVQSNGKNATYNDVKDSIKQLLEQQKENNVIGELINSLKNQSEIVYY
ncbi:SurA N-terminal domain-containing protein [Candidatus Pacearchaeota archaeon]|nr:SurA N-terminal domain-containing protein [Candidatus Pacearchaeota archaeon]